MRSTFKLLFYINRNKVKSDGTTAVLCRISIDGKKSAVTTGVYCKPGDWDSKKCEIKTVRENNRLAAFRSRLEEAYGNLLRNQGVVTAELLKTTVSGANSVPEYLLQAGEVERERLRVRSKEINSTSTYRHLKKNHGCFAGASHKTALAKNRLFSPFQVHPRQKCKQQA